MSSLDDHALLFSSKMSASTELQEEENQQLPPQTQTQTQSHHPNPSSTLLLHPTIQTPTHPFFANARSHTHSPSCELITQSGSHRRKAGGRRKKPKTTQNQASPAATTEYIHVRARRGQATDSHSLAERLRREKISQRMKVLQTLVPGCHKVTGKALMLDEIINYVQSLQNQVEFLSMKLLASVNPILYDYDFGMHNPEVFMGRPDLEPDQILLNGNGTVSSHSEQQQAELAYCINNMPPCNTLFQATVGTGGGSPMLTPGNSSTFIPLDNINPSPLLWLN